MKSSHSKYNKIVAIVSEKSQNTITASEGVSELLNEIYNIMNATKAHLHRPQIPIQEAKLTELITLVKPGCGEDHCTNESGGLPLDWSEYREPGTHFIKASTCPVSISKQLTKVYKMDARKKAAKGKRSREFVIKNYSVDEVGAKLEKILDEMPECQWDFDFEEKPRNPDFEPDECLDDSAWLVDIYKNILNMEVNPETDKAMNTDE